MASLQTAPRSTALQRLRSKGLFRRVASVAKTSLAVVGLGTTLYLGSEYRSTKQVKDEAASDKKRVLILPFHRMKIVDRKKFDFRQSLGRLADDNKEEAILEVEAREVVDAIHAAAADPNIVALYGSFGHGYKFSVGGYAHLEEIRNAIRVFNESHRVHLDPNRSHDPNFKVPKDGTPKQSYAFADTFGHPLDSGNKEYYLASAFSNVCMQPQGELNLFGLATSNMFLRSACEKYGIKVHVFKHGKYKNAPNRLTEDGYTKEHLEQTKSYLSSINNQMCDGIVQSRSLHKTFDDRVWKAIRNHGTLTASNAQELGLVDFLPRIDPLDSFLYANKDDGTLQEMKEKWGNEIDLEKFGATDKVSLSQYFSLLMKRKRVEDRKWKTHETMKRIAGKSAATEFILSMLGYSAPHYNIDKDEFAQYERASEREKIAIVNIGGTIDDSLALKTVNTLRKIKKDGNVKCVILRVDSPGGLVTASETILQECRDLPQPVICSMGNVAASGGYYVATDCDKIFALPTTITGSIGVFGIKVDLTEFASQYGIRVQHVSTGILSASLDPFQPMTRSMKLNFSRNVDRYYDHFKSIVASGRGMSLDEVHAVAQGRVWTGEQAKAAGLVDELGGLSRAIGYAKQHYTSGDADVEAWPKPSSFREKLSKVSENENGPSFFLALLREMMSLEAESARNEISDPLHMLASSLLGRHPFIVSYPITFEVPQSLAGVALTMDESDALRLVLESGS